MLQLRAPTRSCHSAGLGGQRSQRQARSEPEGVFGGEFSVEAYRFGDVNDAKAAKVPHVAERATQARWNKRKHGL